MNGENGEIEVYILNLPSKTERREPSLGSLVLKGGGNGGMQAWLRRPWFPH